MYASPLDNLLPRLCPFHSEVQAAARHGKLGVLKQLRREGADVLLSNTMGQTPLLLASIGGYRRVVDWLRCECRADVNTRDAHRQTALHLACQRRVRGPRPYQSVFSDDPIEDSSEKDRVSTARYLIFAMEGDAKTVVNTVRSSPRRPAR